MSLITSLLEYCGFSLALNNNYSIFVPYLDTSSDCSVQAIQWVTVLMEHHLI